MRLLTVLIFLSITGICFGQTTEKIGSINIESNFYLGSRFVIQGGIYSDSNDYNDFKYTDTVSTLMNSAKFLKGSSKEYNICILTSYPHPFQIGYLDTLTGTIAYSHYFFVGNNRVTIKLVDLFKEKDIIIGNLSKENREYLYLQNLYKRFVNKQTGEIYDLAGKLQVMKKYILKNPNSIVALWDLSLNYYNIRSENDKRNILNTLQSFSDRVKDTKTFKALNNSIIHDLQLVEGNQMPNIFLGGKDSLLSIVSKRKYTLVDFWFSYCTPCIAQFPYYKKLYDSNKVNGFEILAISVDAKKDEINWQNTIAKFKLNWLQFLDTDGKETEKIFIKKYPTNFLLDNKGLILKKDISPDDLDLFLKNNLN
ncbi:MAG: TlpA family protein disulfide reductase [Bacteroidetes bacterium]|nr:TlpA family protein disulfide reductase [Bacteroidota bacterium]